MLSPGRIQRTYNLILSLFWFSTGLTMATSVLLAQARGMDLLQVGLLMAAYSATVVLLEVPTGGLADAVGRKPVSLLAYCILSLSILTFLLAFSFPGMLLGFVLMGVGRALASGALDAWFVDEMKRADPQADLQPALAQAASATLLALGGGTLLGSLLPQVFAWLPEEGHAVLTPLSVPVLSSLLVRLLLVAAAAWLVVEERQSSRAGWMDGIRQVPVIVREGFRLSRRSPVLLLMMGASLATGFALSGLESFWQPRFAELLGGNGSTLILGALMGGNFLVGTLGNLFSTPLARLLKKRYGLVSAIFQGLWGAAILLLGMQQRFLPAALFFWMAYFSAGTLNSPKTALLNEEIPSGQRSAMLSIDSLVFYIGGMAGSALLGLVAERVSISSAWIIAGIVAAGSLLIYLRIDARQLTQRRTPQALAEGQLAFETLENENPRQTGENL